MKKKILLFVLSLLATNLSVFAQQVYLEVKAQEGDGIYSLLRTYCVNTPCNLSHFYRINKLKRNQGLAINKSYKLPIQLHTFNGTSIRSSIGISDWNQAIRIQKYNDFLKGSSGLKKEDFRKDKKLWVPYSLLKCQSDSLELKAPKAFTEIGGEKAAPLKSKHAAGLRGIYKIFGKQHERVMLKGKELEGCVYYIVSGHGGPDPGAVGKRGTSKLCEDEYAYDVSLRLTKNLLEHGATAYVIIRDPDDGIRSGQILPCDKDEIAWDDARIPRSQKPRLHQRSDAVNELYLKNRKQGVTYQRMIAMHVESQGRGARVDMFFYHRLGDPIAKVFAATLQKTIKQKYEEVRKGRGYTGQVTVRDLHMLRETLPPTAFIELGNIRNYADQNRLVIASNRQLVAEWLFEGLMKDRDKYRD